MELHETWILHVINKCHPSWQANSVHPSKNMIQVFLFVFISDTDLLHVEWCYVNHHLGRLTITLSTTFNFFDGILIQLWTNFNICKVFECFIQIMFDWSFENGTSIVSIEVLYHVLTFSTQFIHLSKKKIKTEISNLLTVHKRENVLFISCFIVNLIPGCAGGRFKTNYWELKLELRTNCSK